MPPEVLAGDCPGKILPRLPIVVNFQVVGEVVGKVKAKMVVACGDGMRLNPRPTYPPPADNHPPGLPGYASKKLYIPLHRLRLAGRWELNDTDMARQERLR